MNRGARPASRGPRFPHSTKSALTSFGSPFHLSYRHVANRFTAHLARKTFEHLIEETARHNGHIDILREMLDGVTGD